MFKATLDGNGLVIYSDKPEGELLSSLPEHDGSAISGSDTLLLEPSVTLKGAFAVKNNWDNMASFDRPKQMVDFKPFDMIRFGLFGSQIYNYLLDRHPSLMLIGVEAEYKELAGSTLPVALTMWTTLPGEDSSSVLNPFFFREHTGSTDWQVAHLNLEGAFLDDYSLQCPFKALNFAPRDESGAIQIAHNYEIFGCFKHVGLWMYDGESGYFAPPVFALSGGVGAVRRMSFYFASAQFWGDFQNSAELIQLYERPEPPAPVDPGDPEEPVDPEAPEVIFIFEGGVYNWTCDHPTEGGIKDYPTPNSEEPACALNISSGTVPWSIPYSIVEAGGGPGGVAILYEDGYNIKWHPGSNGGFFRFFADGTWCFDTQYMFPYLPIDETITTHFDFIVRDEFRDYLCRAVATIHGQEPIYGPFDQYTLHAVYHAGKSTDYNENDYEAINFSGNVFSGAHEPEGWTVTKVRGQAYNVGEFVNTVGASFAASMKINENGDYQVMIGGDFFYGATPPNYEYGHVFRCYCSYDAIKNGTTKSNAVYLYVTLSAPPGIGEGGD